MDVSLAGPSTGRITLVCLIVLAMSTPQLVSAMPPPVHIDMPEHDWTWTAVTIGLAVLGLLIAIAVSGDDTAVIDPGDEENAPADSLDATAPALLGGTARSDYCPGEALAGGESPMRRQLIIPGDVPAESSALLVPVIGYRDESLVVGVATRF